MKKLTFAAAVSALALAGAAQATEPFALGDDQLDAMTAAGTVEFTTTVTKTVDIAKTVDVDVDKQVTTTLDLDGSLATAEASADAIDFDNVLAETEVFAQVDSSGAFSFADALAAGENDAADLGDLILPF